ncbi:MAG: O-antigen ligase family protein [Ferruginibacter sp.]
MDNKIENKLINRKDSYLIALNISLGLIAVGYPSIIPWVILGIVFLYVFGYSRNDRSKVQTLRFISYITGLEILYRSTGVTFLPYEISKYVQIGFILMNLFIARTFFTSFIGILIIILLLPSLILFPAHLYKYFIFNTLGVLALGFFIAYTGKHKIDFSDFRKILKSFLYSCIAFVTYITIKTPDFAEIEFNLGANIDTAGGFGSNQVATILGGAVCLLIIMIDQRHYFINRAISIGLTLYFTLRGLLTFSRGGIIGVVLSLIISYIFFKNLKQRNILRLLIIAVVTTVLFVVTNELTGGQLLLRYQGETAGTVAGTREKDANVFLAGRATYAEIDLALWYDHPILGVGPGNSQFMRYQYGVYDEAAPHTEATRLLGENGIFGLAINLILILWPIYIIRKTPDKNIKFIKSILFIFAYATTYHSVMRTGITPLFYGLASMNIIFPDADIKQVS